MLKTIDCSNSSHIAGITYFTETKILTVDYNTGVSYNFIDVPDRVVTGLELAESKGKYLNQCVYGFFQSQKV
jgi:hypothetical protein